MLRRFTAAVALSLGAAALAVVPATAASASPVVKQATKTIKNTIDNGSLVSATPAAGTPNIIANSGSNTAYPAAFAEIPESTGDPEMIVGGTFDSGVTQGGTTQSLNWIFAVDENTGQIVPGFNAVLNGAVRALLPGPTLSGGDPSVYVGGDFTNVDGTTIRHLALIDANTGALVTSFKPTFNGSVHALAMTSNDGGQLLVGGIFTTADYVANDGLASINPTTGALTSYLSNSAVGVLGHHNYEINCQPGGSTKCIEAPVGVNAMSLSPAQSQLAISGNFTSVGGQPRNQLALISLTSSSASVSNWATSLYAPACDYWAYDSYVRDVQFSPDGSYFVVTATGGGGGVPSHATNGGCDSAARFEATGTGTSVEPTWIDFTGQDTTYGLAISNSAVYVGGHYRWMNNPNGANYANLGAVPRPALSALDPANGIPYSWNPGRNPRGIDTFALYLSSEGLWAGYNTNYIGNRKYYRGEMAFFPYAGGESLPGVSQPGLPGNVYQGSPKDVLYERSYNGSNVDGTPVQVPGGSAVNWTLVHGAFMANGNLYYLCAPSGGAECDANNDQGLFEASFNGSSIGTPQWVQPFNDPNWDTVATGSGGTTPDYTGNPPPLYSEASKVTGMTYLAGALYYTMSGSSSLYYTYFEPEDGITGGSMGCPTSDTDTGCVSGTKFTVPNQFTVSNPSNVNFTNAKGLFAFGTELYWADGNGQLEEVPLTVPAAGPAALTGASNVVDTANNWGTSAIFLGPNPASASFTYSCRNTSCNFTGTANVPSGASVTSYAWNFGDTSTSTSSSATTSHTYTGSGSYPVTLTITDSDGDTASASQTVTVAPSPTVTFRAATGYDNQSANPSVTIPSTTVPGDTLLAFLTLNSSAVTVSSPPSGWTLLGSKSLNGMQSLVYTKTAATTDPGSKLTVGLSAGVHADLQVTAYNVAPPAGQTSVPGPQASFATDAGSANHTTPTVTTLPGDQVVSYWSAKSGGAVTWTAPSGQTVENTQQPGCAQPPCGLISSVVADYGSTGDQGFPGVATDSAGGLTATTSASTTLGISWSVILGGNTTNGARASNPSVTSDGAAGADVSAKTVSVTIPTKAAAGDTLLAFLTLNSSTAKATMPKGWSRLASKSVNGMQSLVYRKTANSTDHGRRLTATLSAAVRADLQVAAYHVVPGGGQTTVPTPQATATSDRSTAKHFTPKVSTVPGDQVVSYWSGKSGSPVTWRTPAGQTVRNRQQPTKGSGLVSSVLADYGSGVTKDSAGGLTATTSASTALGISWSVVLGGS